MPDPLPTLQLDADAQRRLGPATVRLEPLTPDHAADLTEAATADADMWRLMPVPPPRSRSDVDAMIAAALRRRDEGVDQPMAVVLLSSGRAVGSTRYLDIQPANRSLEIGWTWYAPSVRRTRVNTECKLLLMAHAFDSMGCLRVQLKTDGRNARSQAAIMRLGARYEGTLRKHRVNHDGYVRDTVFFSVVLEEWPATRDRLEWLLKRERTA